MDQFYFEVTIPILCGCLCMYVHAFTTVTCLTGLSGPADASLQRLQAQAGKTPWTGLQTITSHSHLRQAPLVLQMLISGLWEETTSPKERTVGEHANSFFSFFLLFLILFFFFKKMFIFLFPQLILGKSDSFTQQVMIGWRV